MPDLNEPVLPFIDILPSFGDTLVEYLKNNPMIRGKVEQAVFLDDTPSGESMPCIVCSYVSGGETNDSPRPNIEVVYKVSAYSHNKFNSAQIAGFVHRALNTKRIPLPYEWVNYWTAGYNWQIKTEYRSSQKVYISSRLYEFRANLTLEPTIRRSP